MNRTPRTTPGARARFERLFRDAAPTVEGPAGPPPAPLRARMTGQGPARPASTPRDPLAALFAEPAARD